MKLSLKVRSPVHIGSGQEASPLDYFIEGDQFCRLNMDGLFADPGFKPLQEKFIQSAHSQRYIGDLVPRPLLNRHVAYRIAAAGKARSQLGRAGEVGKTTVKLVAKTAGRVYIPGSSVKGALLSSLSWKILKDGWESGNPTAQDFIRDLLRGNARSEEMMDSVIEKIGGIGEGRFTHWLDIGDSEPKSAADCLELSMVEVQGSRRGAIPILMETLKPGTEFSIELKPDPACRFSVAETVKIANDFYQFIAQADNPSASRPPAQSGLLRLGQGSGFFAISLAILAQQIQEPYERLPRTRRRVDGVLPMGWVELRSSSDQA
jgi:CRISPR type III-A-associated RAMP protein Csm5